MYVLEPYQENLVQTIGAKLATGMSSVLGQLATGGGKTVVFSSITYRYCINTARAAMPQRVLILVHRTELLEQTCRTLKNGFGINAVKIKAGARWIPPAQCYVAMVETLNKRISQIDNIGLVIIDECHLANFNKMFQHFPTQKIIGFSATPLAASKKKPLKMFYQDIVCGIDIPELIAINKKNPERGLVQNITRVPKLTVNRAELSQHIDKTTGDFNVDIMAQQFSKPRNIQNCVDAYRKYADGTKMLIFNVNIEHSLKVMQAFRDAGYEAKHIDGEMSAEQRERILKWFKETPGAILNNVAILTAGYDEPSIETIMVNRSTTSIPLWLQICGRGSRPFHLKEFFTIIDMGNNAPPEGGNLGDWNESRDWNHIFWNPGEPGKAGNAPVKDCPQCDAMVPAQAKVCPYCGYTWPAKEMPPEQQIEDFVVITRGINVAELVESAKVKKQFKPFFHIGDELAKYAFSTITQMDDQKANFILSQYYEKAGELAARENKKWTEAHKITAKSYLYFKLAGLFKEWTPSKN